MVFGPFAKVQKSGSSVDPPPTVEQREVQETSQASTKDQTAETPEPSKVTDKSKNTSAAPAKAPSTPQRSPKIKTDAKERLVIHFHAVLSKDFKFDQRKDEIFVQAGDHIGLWGENIVEMNVIRDLGKHGLLVEGQLETSKSKVVHVAIPYKYIIFRSKKRIYEYEYIYKLDSDHVTYRCLFVKNELVSSDGAWHQYDDIICAKPDRGFFHSIKEKLWSQEKRNLIRGRQIAAEIMLGTIFDLLKDWSGVHVKNFISQLRQFFDVYSDPFVFENNPVRWESLGFGKEDVIKTIKKFMLFNVIPQLLRNQKGKNLYVQDSLKAAVIMVCVWYEYGIHLDHGEICGLCTALVVPQLNQESFVKYWEQFLQDAAIVPYLTEILISLIHWAIAEHVPDWILVLPTVHLLKGIIKPYEASVSSNAETELSWAGLEGIVNIQRIENMNNQNKGSLVNLMKKHLYLKEIDVLVVRSWLYIISLGELLDCSLHLEPELLDILHIFNAKVPKNISYFTFKVISDTIEHIHGNLKQDKYSSSTEMYRKQCLAFAVELLAKICKAVDVPTYYANYTGVFVSCIHLVASVSDFETSERTKELEYSKDCLGAALGIVRKKLSQCFPGSLLKDTQEIEVSMWNSIISVNFKDDVCTSEWRDKLTKDLEDRYNQEPAMRRIEYYCIHIDRLSRSHSYVASCIEKWALDAVTSVCQSKSEGKILEKITSQWFGKFGKLVSAIVEKSWPKHNGDYCDDEETVLQHVLSWPASTNIFQLYVGEKGLPEKLSCDANKKIVTAVSTFTDVVDQVVQGNVKMGLLNIVLEKIAAFVKLIEIDGLIDKTRYKSVTEMKRLLQLRQNEVNAVLYEKELVDCLLTMSNTLPQNTEFITVDVDDIKERRRVNFHEMPLNTFLDVHLLEQITSDKPAPVTYFNLDEDIRNMAETIYTCKDSYIFQMCWEQHVKAFVNEYSEEEVVSLQTLCEDVFSYCFDEYKEIYSSLKNGSITLERINELFKDYKEKYEELQQELETMCNLDQSDDKRWVSDGVQQIKEFHELHLAVASANIIMAVKSSLCLQGDFKILEKLIKVNQHLKRVQLSQIDNNLIQAKKALVDITKTRQDCLRELELRTNFVHWVKEALEDINELKVFVDLASISAGENDMDVDRVACFHDAVLGYSSMLYELKQDSDFHDFKIVVEKLWRALENDHNLPKKLRDSARHLEWLKTVKESHGSVELSSLSLATAINKMGVYVISAQSGRKLSLDEAIKLQIPEEHDDGQQMRNYSLEDLRELQNKLMLMSGKGDQGQQEVNHFTEVFDNVQRLSEAFIALYTAGNPLFRHWEAHISCCTNSNDPCIKMDFNLKGVFSAVIIEGCLEEQLPDLCRKIETCFQFWMDFVGKQRSQHYYLNYYTAEQIVYLCSNLSQQNDSHVMEQTLMMLSFIKPECSTAELRQAWDELQYDILNQPQEQNKDIELQIFTIVESGISDIDSEFDLLPSLSELQNFDEIWNTHMKDMKGSLPDVLDWRTLGRLLEILANKGTESESDEDISNENGTMCIYRELPNGLSTGKPNLVVCPHEDILTSCVSTYMSRKNESLPSYDEVLLCTSTTSYEQVELFLRRCLSRGYIGNKIYSLLYADVLTYDVSSKAESFFYCLKMQSRSDYRLVIFCSSEREHAYFPSAFSQYKVHNVPQAPLPSIQKYLHDHYVVPEGQCSAAAAFKDRLCVGIVSSSRAGVGKSLYIRRLYEKLSTTTTTMMKCIRLIEPTVDEDIVLQSLLNHTERKALTVFHFDVTSSVQRGLHEFLFKLLFLRFLMDSEGKVWKCNEKQLYVVEMLVQSKATTRQAQKSSFTDVFPNIFCRPPKEVLEIELKKNDVPTFFNSEDPLMDDEVFRSAAFQRPYQYLTRFYNHVDLDRFTYHGVKGSHGECLQMLLMYCGIMDPTWAELRNFAWFLNLQLQDCETSVFCNAEFIGETLVGFKGFVVDFMILMAKDFATPSLSISDQSPGQQQMDLTGVREEDLAPFLIRKRWETEPHPYIFFNDDHVSMTFIGFHLQPNNRNAVDAIEPVSGRIIKRNVMTKQLYDGLTRQRMPFNIDFDQLPREEKIKRLCNVLRIQKPLDPDETYELTTDNILKILAIHMRFRCGIPVIIMGETGCGKTRLIKFLCELRKSGETTENLKLVKVHGGTTSSMVYAKVKEAERMATINKQVYGIDSVLFFDEANTTEAISSIKEVLCDKTVQGEGLNSICESAGLGYRVRAEETDEKLGSIPLRQLVYRVHALPPSMIPLVWDFGQLNDTTEKNYIQEIVQRVVQSCGISADYVKIIVNVLSASQKYMRRRKDECSFVSLRDVERCIQAFVWFLNNHGMFLNEISQSDSSESSEERDAVLWALIMATGVCYHACLEKKKTIGRKIYFTKNKKEILLMQDLLLDGVPMGNTIARNNALKENVFMMVLCIELRIPLFLVGKPGSSKSLSKTLVADAMQVSFQCSPHSTPEGIISTFKQCGRFQEGKNLDEYISVVVLDEIGLAEDSPKMPLKTLHPLLEEGCIDDKPSPYKKRELVESAKGICSSDKRVLEMVKDYFKPFAEAYLDICRQQGNGFFGLRDYYSLIKMIFAVAKQFQRKPTAEEVLKAVLRNFSGTVDVDAVSVFKNKLEIASNMENISAIEFVKENIQTIGQDEDCRYLLILTKNYVALQILQQTFFNEGGQPEIIFGSSFPKDQEYTQICRNINRVKICMETGQTVVLLNLQNLYESLYDALNQYYVYLGGQKYVDLGLGTHRVKCRVHKDFRLIVIEEREVVYQQFPIPLINRLEKHFLDIHTVLKAKHKTIVKELEKWVEQFVSLSSQQGARSHTHKYRAAEVFIGYHSDACASVVLQVLENQNEADEMIDPEKKVLDEAKLVLLKCATPDSVVRLDCSELPTGESEHLAKVYSEEWNTVCLSDYILTQVREEQYGNTFFTEVTTFSRLLTASDLKSLEQNGLSAELLSVQQFDTQHFFLKKIRYSSINEIRKIVLENTGHKVFVYFLSRLPRMIGGTSYVGFHGGPWKSVHIDDLRRSNEMVSDIIILQKMTISQLFEIHSSLPEAMEVNDDIHMETEQDNLNSKKTQSDTESVLDTTTLLRSCVQSAVGMLRDQLERGFRNTHRLELLLTLFENDDEIKEGFNKMIKKRIQALLSTHVDSTLSSIKNNWVMREASNIDALQEGGTFRNTLWKRIQAVVTPMLAHLVAVSDRDQNLDLLLDANCGTSLKKLWLDIFGDEKLLQIPPTSQDPKSHTTKFDDFFWSTPVGLFIAKEDQDTQMDFYYRYLQDYVLLTLNVTCKEEMQLLTGALNCCVNELKIKLDVTDRPTSLSWIHTAYHEFKNRLQNLSRMMCIEPRVTGHLLTNPSYRDEPEMVLDVYAALACVEHLEPRVLSTDNQRQAWLRDAWNRILCLSLFVDHILLVFSVHWRPQDPVCLPCQHIYCLPCIRQWLVPGQMYCPYCKEPVNDDFPVVPSEDIRIKINVHAQFRRRCNAFFVELVSSVCFRDNIPPSSKVIKDLLSFLIHETTPSVIPGAQRKSQIVTKEFSPFDESLDKSPVVRSVVLKLLMKYSFDQIKKYLEDHLCVVEESYLLDQTEKTELYLLYINCFEDSMFETLCLRDESDFLACLLSVDPQILLSAPVDCLQIVARVRLDLNMAAALLSEGTTAAETEEGQAARVFLKSVKDFCTQSKNDWYRVYLIRKIGSQQGMEHVQNLLKVQQMSWLFPEEILQQVNEAPMDLFLVCGPEYQTIRNAVAEVLMNGSVDGLDETCERCRCVNQSRAVFLLLALYREVTTWYRQPNENLHPKPEQINLWMGYIQSSKVLTSPEWKAFAQSLVTNQLGPLTLRSTLARAQCVFIELTVHLVAVLLCGNQGILAPLKRLAFAPASMQAAFLPSMPEDKVTMAQQAMQVLERRQLHWYTCPNGHPCAIGECGRPTVKSYCVDCGAEIGGLAHVPVQGFQDAQLQGDRTQRGHILGHPRRRNSPDMLDTKSLPPVPFALIRMVTHMAMLFGLHNNTQVISTMIKPQVADPGEFLFAHLREDQKQLIKFLGKGADDTVSSVHLIVSRLLHPQQQTWVADPHLSTNKARNNWEIQMSNVLAPLLKNLDKKLKEVNTFIHSDDRISASPIIKVMFGDPRLFLGSLPKNSLVHCSTVWSSREKVSLLGLTHILEQSDAKDELPVLWKFLHREAEYRLVKYLPDILILQKNLVKIFQNVGDLYGTIAEFLQSQQSVSLKSWYEKHVKIVLTTWNQLRVFLSNNGEIKLPPSLCERDFDLSCDFSVLLPSRHGPGLCSTALVSYLVALHNDLVYSVDKLTGEETSYKVSPADLTELHVVRYELDRDLMPLVLSNTQYSIEKGQETVHEFDLPKIQQQIVSRFLSGKPLITFNAIPTLINRHERNYEIILKDVKEKIKQEPLQTLTQCAVSSELDSYSEVCDALSTVEVALGFLAMTGGDPCMQLSRYLLEVLKMSQQTPPHILKALSMCCLKHCSALWQLLGSLKSQGLLKLKRDPFGSVSKDYKQALGENERRLLTGFFSKNSANSFLLEMHEFLALVLNKPRATDTYKPQWGLKETLVSYMERKDMDVPPDVEELFPEEVCLSHYVEAWKFCVSFRQERYTH
ncbi:hypothetical protein WMY93_008318 [Mugilogobius chulae]|uniref:Ring finger protein 213 n=1 Tax=Mugilogobius chulae TaxID=88201 RepID=A0AAW0PPK0_9GOBI